MKNKNDTTDELGVKEIVQTQMTNANGKNKKKTKDETLILDRANPLQCARMLMSRQFTTTEGVQTLWRHRGCFWLWSGSYYQLANDETIRTYIWTFLEKANRQEADKVVPFKPKRQNVGEVADALTAICQLDEHIDPPKWLSRDAPPVREFFACANGLLHLPTGKLHKPTPDYFCLNASDVVYDPAMKPPQWLAFLRELLDKDQEAIDLLQDWTGYTLSPDTSQQKICGVIGPPRSGKGTLARILTKLLGTTSVAGPSMNSLGETFGLEPLIPKSLSIISDVRIGSRTDKSTVVERLLSISGEDQMTVARKFNSAWHGKLMTRVMFLTNEFPALTDGSGAFASRLVIVVLTKSFLGKEDPQLTDKLSAELSGILNWGITGYRRLAERGSFVQPESAREAAEAIENLGAPIKAFVRECCEIKPGVNVLLDNLFTRWREWCEDEGRKEAGTKEWFSRNLHSTIPGLRIERPQTDGKRVRYYEGITLRSEHEPYVRIVEPQHVKPSPRKRDVRS